MSATGEKMLALLGTSLAATFLAIGIWLTVSSGQAEWLKRAGAAIVCAQALIIVAEFSMRLRVRALETAEELRNRYFQIESARAETKIMLLSVVLATAGEFLHGFGDLLADIFL
jgi:hypothetical protein